MRKPLGTSLLTTAPWLLAATPGLAGQSPPGKDPPGPAAFSFTLSKPALTSAGVYGAQGRLVRTLWSLKPLLAVQHSGHWGGLDEFGRPAPGGGYEFPVVANRSTYLSPEEVVQP